MAIIFDIPLEISAKEVLRSFTHKDLRNFQLVSKEANAIIQAAAAVRQDDIDPSGKQIKRIPGSAPAFIRQRFRTETFASHPSWLNLVHHFQKSVTQGDPNDIETLLKCSFDWTKPDRQRFRLQGILVLFDNTMKSAKVFHLGGLLPLLADQQNNFELAQAVLSHPGAKQQIRLQQIETIVSKLSRFCEPEDHSSVRLLKLLFGQSIAANFPAQELQLDMGYAFYRGNAEFVRVLFTHQNAKQIPTVGEYRYWVGIFPPNFPIFIAVDHPISTMIRAYNPLMRYATDLESAFAIAVKQEDYEMTQAILSHPNADQINHPGLDSCTIL
jgi:hypothetical protein